MSYIQYMNIPIQSLTRFIENIIWMRRILLFRAIGVGSIGKARGDISEESYLDILNSLEEALYITTVEGEFYFANNAFLKIPSIKKSELVGSGIGFLNTLAETNPDIFNAGGDKSEICEAAKPSLIREMANDKDNFYVSRSLLIKNESGEVSHHLRILHNQSEATAQLKHFDGASSNAVEILNSALAVRDPYTAGHEQRVADICEQLCLKLGLPQRQIEGVKLGALIHDIGKIQIPSELLSKSTKLTKEEFALIECHPTVGAELINSMSFDWPIREMVLQHHERLDGSGYPNGLNGDQIILEAQIIAVADVVEAMLSHRPYRAALSLEETLYEISSGAGVRYGAEIAGAMVSLLESSELSILEI